MSTVKNKKGFTLVELMIVVVIMGILVAVAVPVYGAVTKNSEKKTCHSNNEIIVKAAAQFMITTGESSTAAIFTDHSDSALIESQADASSKLDSRFVACFEGNKFPVCPSEGKYMLAVSDDGRSISVTCSEHGTRYD